MLLRSWVLALSQLLAPPPHLASASTARRRRQAHGRLTAPPAEVLEPRALLTAAPVFSESSYAFTIPENSTSIGGVAATDDEGIFGYMSSDSNFWIDGNGTISTMLMLDYESLTTNPITFTVTAYGFDMQMATATVSITVTNVAEDPTFNPTSYTFSVAETAASETVVGSVSATDPQNDIFGYSLSGSGSDSFSISMTGEITVNGSLDFESTPTHNLTVHAYDMQGSVTAPVTIDVTDVDEDPVFNPTSYTFSVPENAIIGDIVGSVFATDPQNDIYYYSINFVGVGGTQPFYDDPIGNIILSDSLDFETTEEYALTVAAYDMQGSGVASITINVTDVWENTTTTVNPDYYDGFDDTIDITVDAANGVLSNDLDSDTSFQTLTVYEASSPTNGTLTLNSDGSFAYNANDNFFGTDYFSYYVNDGVSDSPATTVTIRQNSMRVFAPPASDPDAPGNQWLDVTNGNGGNLRVGEVVRARAEFKGPAAVPNPINYLWTVPAIAVAGYTASTETGEVIPHSDAMKKAASVGVHFVDGGQKGLQIAASVGNINIQKTVAFTIDRPQIAFSSVKSVVTKHEPFVGATVALQGSTVVLAGDLDVAGVEFSFEPAPADSKLFKVQILNMFRRIYVTEDLPGPFSPYQPGISQFPARMQATGLDTGYPYPFTGDSPLQGLYPISGHIDTSDSFAMYLMFKSDRTGSIAVPLKVINWSWGFSADQSDPGDANNDGIRWTVYGAYLNVDAAINTTSHPEWNRLVTPETVPLESDD